MGALRGQVAVVAGGAGGVGTAIAEAFSAAGAEVLTNGGPGPADGEGLVDVALERFGKLDVIVLNTGGRADTRPIVEMTDEDWGHALEVSLNQVFRGMRRALAHMIPRRSGRVIVTSAAEGKLGRGGASGYVAAQHGVTGLVKSAAQEVGTLGITVNAILPGVIASDAGDSVGDLLERSKTKRPTTLEQIAGVAVLLAAPSMTSMTGCLFPVDGGATPY